jgi:two-component system, NarL family, response regulator DegU
MTNKLKIVIADDHPIFLSGVREELNRLAYVKVVGEAINGVEAYQQILATLPDVAILDLEMPQLTGLDVAKKVLSEKSTTKFIILTMHKSKQYFVDAIESGVLGYLVKDNAISDLVACIDSVLRNEVYVSSVLQQYLQQSNDTQHEEIKKINATLTATEKVILKLISEGNTSNQIAALLFISPNTVDNHRSNIAKKLNIEGKNSLLKYSISIKELL